MFTVFNNYSNRELEDMLLTIKSESTRRVITGILDNRYSVSTGNTYNAVED